MALKGHGTSVKCPYIQRLLLSAWRHRHFVLHTGTFDLQAERSWRRRQSTQLSKGRELCGVFMADSLGSGESVSGNVLRHPEKERPRIRADPPRPTHAETISIAVTTITSIALPCRATP